MGCFLPSVFFCSSTAPSAKPDASTSTSNCLSSSGCARTGSLVMHSLGLLNASSCLDIQFHSMSFLISSLSGHAICANPLMNGL